MKRAVVIVALASAAFPLPALGQESAKDVIAAHIRSQGYACTTPKSAARQPAASRPGEQAWTLTCGEATYLVRLIPDMAADVSVIGSR
ncbi:MAG: hypothetical protein CTY15_08925 [Methylocystis sp.]|nr:MAG: hypothetical protein CTY15_08925 [Methylocystis sp.]